MKQQFLDPEAVIRSLRIAFAKPADPSLSIQRIRGMISQLPSGPLYVVRCRSRSQIWFYEKTDSGKAYLRKDSDRLYLLARGKYLRELQNTLTVRIAHPDSDREWTKAFERIAALIRKYAAGDLDIARVVLTARQYVWFTGKYRKKAFRSRDGTVPLCIDYGGPVRSKSEQRIGNALWAFGIPAHYEEPLFINVQRLVQALESSLKESGQFNQPLFRFHEGSCYWSVPSELQFMNTPGSLWRSYNYRSGTVVIHPDFTIMLMDGQLLYWEHEGLFHLPVYRVNAVERTAVMRIAGNVRPEQIIETIEKDSADRAVLEDIISGRIIPGIWF